MTFNLRMLGPVNTAHQTKKVNGRTYTAVAGAVLTVPEHDGLQLQANGWTVVALSGPTSARPSSRLGNHPVERSTQFWDETLGQLIISDGTTWRDPTTGNVV